MHVVELGVISMGK